MNKIDEIKEALDFVDYPDYEFRSFCNELVGMVEEQEKEIIRLNQVVANIYKAQEERHPKFKMDAEGNITRYKD